MRRLALLGIVGALLLVLLEACCGESKAVSWDDLDVVLPVGVLFQVVTPNEEPVSFTIEQVEAMPQVSIEVDGRIEEGPALLTVLAEAGVDEFSSVTLHGLNLNIVLESRQVTDEVILSITNWDTVKFASPAVPGQNWPKGIMLIVVE
jgi:hypothetical protein